ncbi:PREDICTED: uncharacterized protein LOC109189578 isoform X1 [Ipomoea nil]|uniref:uncharacterized protein LOC109189578 isoform X1 n=1 Tax=Ipomoea nil TaxID=35883 RepID=UPI000901A9F8|nr:PREDICTED: uncharacterized protein LOC109189578 isoform X1 [Ipomoea nil]XP_019195733.1 PREDICTED: uncharacterized protein LOC109189578 isoform X1 [Ipomoea nil]
MDCWFTPYSDIKIVGMIFFPILCRGHYFLLCFDILHYRYEITDNDSDPTSKTLKYGDSLEDMKDMLYKFFNIIHHGRSALCACLDTKRLQMSRRDSKNKTYCGVFLMRHMDSYVG